MSRMKRWERLYLGPPVQPVRCRWDFRGRSPMEPQDVSLNK
jgi:hypothetical protein